MRERPPIRRGLALIVVVGILGVTAALAVAFVTMAHLERKASAQRVNAVRAFFLARSGIEDALARLALGQDPVYRGEDWNANGALDTTGAAAIETASEVYKPGALNTDDCPVRYALRPSFFVAQTPGVPATIPVDGRQRGLSGRLSADYGRPNGQSGNQYALKAGTYSGFYINGGDPAHPSEPTATSDYNTNLRRMLGILAQAIDTNPDGTRQGILSRADGESLIARRPTTGWLSLDQVRDIALGGSQAKLDAIKDYLALNAWVDRKVIAPTASSELALMDGTYYRSWADILMDVPSLNYTMGEFSSAPPPRNRPAPDFEKIGGKVAGRAPVDLGWARARLPALVALLADLKGVFLDESVAQSAGGLHADCVGRMASASLPPLNAWAHGPTGDEVYNIAWALNTAHAVDGNTYTTDIRSWSDWDVFCTWLSDTGLLGIVTGVSDGVQAKRDILRANFNPNSDLNKFNPEPSLAKLVDKSDLMVYSTEFSLVPALRAYRISSAGRVLDGSGRLLASRTLSAVLPPPSVIRLTTQADFVCDKLVQGDQPDPASFRSLGSVSPPFVTPSSGGGYKTFGGNSLAGGFANGVSLQTYPEPLAPGSNLGWPRPAFYDGQVKLATLEDVSHADNNPGGGLTFLASWTNGYAATYASGDPNPAPTENSDVGSNPNYGTYAQAWTITTDVEVQPPIQTPCWTPDASQPAMLRPDGIYSECFRQPGFYAVGNLPGSLPPSVNPNWRKDPSDHGVVSFWVKPNYDVGKYLKKPFAPSWGPSAQDYERNHLFFYSRRWSYPRSDPIMDENSGREPWIMIFHGNHAIMDFYDAGTPAAPADCRPDCFQEAWSWGDWNNGGGSWTGPFHNWRQTPSGFMAQAHRWYLLNFHWEMNLVPTGANSMVKKGGDIAVDYNTPWAQIDAPRPPTDGFNSNARNTADTGTPPTLTTEDILSTGPAKPVFYLGRRGYSVVGSPYGFNPGTDWTLWAQSGATTNSGYVGYDFAGPPDATFDEFAIYDSNAWGATPWPPPVGSIPNRARDGRFYKESLYTGPADPGNVVPPAKTAAQYYSPRFDLGPVRIKGFCWTQAVPKGLKFPLPSGGQPGWDGDKGADGLIGFDLAEPTGVAYATDISNAPISGFFTDDAFSAVNRQVNSPFRLHAVFLPNLDDAPNTPILDPLALDDVTLIYDGGPAILRLDAWKEGD